MKKNQDQPVDAGELRRRAEERLDEKRKSQRPEADDRRTTNDAARLVHELQVHQIELEMQNEELKQARAQAEASLARYTELYEFAPTAYLTLDREGAIRQVNLTGTLLLGVERSGLLKRRFGTFVADADRRPFSDFLAKVFASEAKESCEVTLPREGSVPLIVQIEGRRTADGQECCVVVWDVTERKRAEEALFQSTERLSLAQRSAGAGVWNWDIPGNTLDWTPELFRLFGLDVAKTGATFDMWRGVLHPEDRQMAEENISKAISDHKQLNSEYRIILSSGEVRWISALGDTHYDGNGDPVRMMGICLDMTERKRADEELQENETRLSAIFKNIPTGLFIVNEKTRIIFDVNDSALETIGLPRGDVVGKVCHKFLCPAETGSCPICDLGQVVDRSERVLSKQNGTRVPILKTVVPITLKGENYFLESFIDITDRKLAEANQAQLENQLRQAQKMETVGRLAGGVAHDFNNMLQVIMSYVEMSLAKVEAGQPLQKYLLEIQRAALRSAEITGQLLAFARKQTISPKVLDLNDAVPRSQKMLQRLIGEDISLAWTPGRDLWKVKIDPSQLDQVLANLAVNARDAISGVGTLTVETANLTVDEAYCATHADTLPGEYVLLAVSDNGCGMDKETLSHMFEPFFTTKEQGKGTGLGLATVYGIVKQNDGFINVYSEPGEGTTFRVYLPRAKGAPGADAQDVEAVTPRGGTETVLVVEDEAAILELARESLEQLGYTVLSSGTPEEGLRAAGGFAGRIDLLITDVVMPQMNGRQLAGRLSAARPELKCLYMSGYTADVIAHRGVLEEGMSFISKPFSLTTLAEKVREVLDHEA